MWGALIQFGCTPADPVAVVPEPAPAVLPDGPPEYVGVAACEACHTAESEAWRGSHHDLAMDAPLAATLPGGTDDMRFRAEGDTVWVALEGPDGEPVELPVKWTFGVTPLQQFLVELPDGRVGATTTVWDARPAADGGQRFYSLYPDEALHAGDPLHWTGFGQRWNAMCGDCHSTGFRKGLDPETGVYDTKFAEIDVGCEACHGPGSLHVASAGASDLVLPRRDRRWPMEADGIAARAPASTEHPEVEACGRCHSRRSPLVEAYTHGGPLLDTHAPVALDRDLYFVDGQIQDEVYVWGSFRQSKMHEAGVECSDCHDPHSGRTRAQGDALCGSCHDLARWAARAHTHHEEVGCVDCHMPARTYMGVDARRDHSFRVPRPDLGTPSPCTDCHDQGSAWAAAAIAEWTGAEPPPHFAQILALADSPTADTPARLAALAASDAPAIVRATALARLAEFPTREAFDAGTRGLDDADPQVRREAVRLVASLAPPDELARRFRKLLEDPVRNVRIEAARPLGGALPVRGAYAAALGELRENLQLHTDQSAAWVQLGLLHLGLGEREEARHALRRAIELEPDNVAAWADLAEVERRPGDESGVEAVLAEGLAALPDAPELLEARGLSLARAGRTDEALAALQQAAATAHEARPAWLVAVTLHGRGQSDDAVAVLEATHALFPADRQVLQALVTVNAERGRADEALRWATVWSERVPWDPTARQFLTHLSGGPR